MKESRRKEIDLRTNETTLKKGSDPRATEFAPEQTKQPKCKRNNTKNKRNDPRTKETSQGQPKRHQDK